MFKLQQLFFILVYLLQLSQEAVQSLIRQFSNLKHGHCMTFQVLRKQQVHCLFTTNTTMCFCAVLLMFTRSH